MFLDSTLLITGGTGSFGNALLNRSLDQFKEIRIFSRDEKKQDDMRKKFVSDKLSFIIGDVRDSDSLETALRGVDYVFHAAALKQVPSCEFYPLEAVYTNIIGTSNVINASLKAGVSRTVCLSTDKSVYPVNAMGISKAMMEKVMISKSRFLDASTNIVCGTRYGNVMASRGSVIPLFCDQLLNNKPLTITNPLMTRFMMTLDNAVDLVFFAFKNGQNGDIFVQKSPAATIHDLAAALMFVLNKPNHPVSVIGTRHGEKLYESLLSSEEASVAVDLGDYFRVSPDGRDLNYESYVDTGVSDTSHHFNDYNSHNTTRLNVEQLVDMLTGLPYIDNLLQSLVK